MAQPRPERSFDSIVSKEGLALAASKTARFGYVDQQTRSERVENPTPPDFCEGSEMFRSLACGVENAAARAALRSLGEGE